MLAFAQTMALEYESLRADLSNGASKMFGMLRVGVIPSALPLIPELTLPFHQQHPRVNLKIVNINPPEVLQRLDDFSIDVAISYLEEEASRRCRTHRLYAESFGLLIRKGTLYSGRKFVSWEEASRLRLCLLAPEMQHGGTLPAGLFGKGVARLSYVETNSIIALYSEVRTGACCSVLPRSLATMANETDELETLLLPKSGKQACVGILMVNREVYSPLAEAFFKIASNVKVSLPRQKQ